MLGRWIRLIEAERALAAARFAEALDLAGHESVRAHRRADTVRRKAAEAILARARASLDRGDLSSAVSDLRLAGRAGANLPEEKALERAIRPRLEEKEGRRRLVAEALAAAGAAEKEGDVVRARDRLRSVPAPPPPIAERLAAVEKRIQEQERAAEEATRACEKGDPEAAERALERLRRLSPRHPLLPSLDRALDTARRIPSLRAEAERAGAGEASRAFAFLSRHAHVRPDLLRTAEAGAILRAVRRARRARVLEHLRAGEFRAAAAQARRFRAAGEEPADRGLVDGSLCAARGAEALARGEGRVARDALDRAARADPAVAAACEPLKASLGPPPPRPSAVEEAEVDAARRPWDAAALDGALRVAEVEEKRSAGEAEVRAAAGRIRRFRSIAQRHRGFREALERGLLAHAARELGAAVDHLRRLEELEAGEDLRVEGASELLEAIEARLREGKKDGLGGAIHDSSLEELCAGLFEDRLLGLRDAAPAEGIPPKAEGAKGLRRRDPFPLRFVLRMDEAGDALVLARETLRIGHAREPSNDLSLLARVAAAHAEIRRKVSFHEGVAYELLPAPGRPVARNGEAARGPVALRDGDRIGLGETFAFEFRLPSRESRSALLLLQPGSDVGGASAVVLLKPGVDGRISIGGGPDAHLGAGRSEERVELFLDDRGFLVCRSDAPLLVDGSPVEGEVPLSGGEEVAAGGLRFFVARD
ncbi:MAG TPA: FHA domain-containing protein [Planctomycetota bacterium]|jgi:hypothetical protein|nr:FHA domain-containing protein [Planctomycetota bacterium]